MLHRSLFTFRVYIKLDIPIPIGIVHIGRSEYTKYRNKIPASAEFCGSSSVFF